MISILQDITHQRALDAVAECGAPLSNPLRPLPGTPSFHAALAAPGLSVIAEVKRKSPSRGDLAAIADPVALASDYAEGGAAAISVLTEPHRFGGRDEDLQQVVASLSTPALRKDFVSNAFQIHQAKALGASAVLLIVALFPGVLHLRQLLETAHALKLDVLVETHDADELHRAIEAGARIIGVNHRNLRDFTMDMGLFERLRASIPSGIVTVAESGIMNAADANRMRDAGADAILVGELLARSANPRQELERLLGRQSVAEVM